MTAKELIENHFNRIDVESYIRKVLKDMLDEQYYRDVTNSFITIKKPAQKLLEYKGNTK